MSHGLPGFDHHSDDSSHSGKAVALIVVIIIALGCVFAFVNLVSVAFAASNPSDYQHVRYGLVGKKKSVSLSFESWFDTQEALKHTPASILVTNIVFPKELVPQANSFPKCEVQTILDSPQDCPKKSLLSEGFGESLLRPRSNTSGVIISKLKISLQMFNSFNNKIYIRAYSNLSNRLILEGTMKKSNDKRYSRVLSFVFPRGANTPVPGVIVQLQKINLFVTGNYNGKNLFSLKCKTGKKLNFSYWSAFNIDGEKATTDSNALVINDLVVGAIGNPLKQTVSCPK